MNIPRFREDKWSIIKAAGLWWAECPSPTDAGCLCESFSEYEAALAHVLKPAARRPPEAAETFTHPTTPTAADKAAEDKPAHPQGEQ